MIRPASLSGVAHSNGRILVRTLFALVISVGLSPVSGCAVQSQFAKEAMRDPDRPIAVVQHGSTFANSVGGVSYAFGFVNTSGKTIKYLEADVEPYNRVGDKVADRVGGTSKATMQVTGPYPPGASNISRMPGIGAPRFGVVWYQGDVACAVLTGIRIEYMDDEKVSLTGDGLRKVIEKPGCAHAVHGVLFPSM